MLTIKPYIFKRYPGIMFGFSTKFGVERELPYYFNMSYNIGDDSKCVSKNREKFFNSLGLNQDTVAYQKQLHGDSISVIERGGDCGESDALITTRKNLGLAISSADCCAIFLYDPINEVIAAVHSGWRGTEKEILLKVLQKLSNDYNSVPGNLICYLAPSISRVNYEVGPEVADKFDLTYLQEHNEKFLLNIPQMNYDILLNYGVFEHKIQMSRLCSFEYKSLLHSYRRDGEKSGRSFGIIAMKGSD
ncbi:MAG: peptidoglycan editing factor PgeF [Ignavibacteria bacterium]|jgi:YfiH family protein